MFAAEWGVGKGHITRCDVDFVWAGVVALERHDKRCVCRVRVVVSIFLCLVLIVRENKQG